jgi:hypothetical protein
VTWWRRSTLELDSAGVIRCGSFIWEHERPVPIGTSATCGEGLCPPCPGPRCGCGYSLSTREKALVYPGAGLCAIAEVEPVGPTIVEHDEFARSRGIRLVGLSIPAVCMWCQLTAPIVGLSRVRAGRRDLLVGCCAAHVDEATIGLPEVIERRPVRVVAGPEADGIRDQFVRDTRICDERGAWWVLRAIRGARDRRVIAG